MYHPHLRPLTTPLATLLSASAQGHKLIRSKSQLPIPTPASILEVLASRLESSSLPSTRGRLRLDQNGEGEDNEGRGGWLATTLRSSANALQTPPMHVDHVALAACTVIERSSDIAKGPAEEEWDDGENVVLGVTEMRELIGWRWEEKNSRRPSYSPGSHHSE